jgi:serine O-acetyltransferase
MFTLIVIIFNFIRCFPHLIVFYLHINRPIIQKDTQRWLHEMKINYGQIIGFIYLLGFIPEFRNLFYNRIGKVSHFLNIFCPKVSTFYLYTRDIGEGLFIRHGFASGISAKSIGKNCTIYNHVVIGNNKGFPTILDNVTIFAGAVIMGKITIGNNSIIGANATVLKDVPDNCTVYPASSVIMRWNGETSKTDSKDKFNQVD